jgi:hypothetical protein
LEFKTSFAKYGNGFILLRRALQDYPKLRFDVTDKFEGSIATFSQKIEPPRKNIERWLKRQ